MRSIRQETVDLVKQFEGLRLKAYQDSVGIWTIGYGHIKGVHSVMRITEQQAKQYLINDLATSASCVDRVITKPMNHHERGAFISLTFNIGVNAFTKSTAARKFNKGDKRGAAQAILLWNKITVNGVKVVSQGLVNRRASEAVYFEMNVTDASLPTHFYETTAGEGDNPTITAKSASIGSVVLAAVLAASTSVVLFIEHIKEFIHGLF